MKKRAVALRYEKNKDRAPRIVAKGSEEVAKRIIAAAQKNKITVHEDKELVSALMQLDLNSVIPEEMYQAVAEVLAYVYRAGSKR